MANPPHICVIDDDILVRDALALGLADAGFEVTCAPGAAAGFDLISRTGADAMVTDMRMPGTDGAQLIKQARAKWPNLPIVAITGASEIDGRDAADVARESGANASMAKPFRASELASVLRDLLGDSATASTPRRSADR